MCISKRSTTLTGFIAAIAAVLVLLAAIDSASAKTQGRSSSGTNHIQAIVHPASAKNDHGHRHHRHEFKFARLLDRPVYCDCSYDSCPEWIVVQCVGYRPRHVAARRAEPTPRCICSDPDPTDPNYD
jgi:hypothetical protein